MSAASGGLRVLIASGQTTSAAIDLGDQIIVGIQIPSAFTGVALTFQAAYDNATFVAVTDKSGAAYSVTVAASKYVSLSPLDLAGVRYVKFVSGASEGADRTIGVITRTLT